MLLVIVDVKCKDSPRVILRTIALAFDPLRVVASICGPGPGRAGQILNTLDSRTPAALHKANSVTRPTTRDFHEICPWFVRRQSSTAIDRACHDFFIRKRIYFELYHRKRNTYLSMSHLGSVSGQGYESMSFYELKWLLYCLLDHHER